jgi:hypothetical protein
MQSSNHQRPLWCRLSSDIVLVFAIVGLSLCPDSVIAQRATKGGARPAGVWLKGDVHVHGDRSSDGSYPRQRNHDKAKGNVSIADQIEQATRNGLAFLLFTDHRTYDQHYDPQWESSALLLIPGEEANLDPHATSLGGVDSIVQGAARADRAGFTHAQQSVWDAHSQGAIWSVAHPDDGELNADGSPNAFASVQGVNLVEIWNRAKSVEKQIDYSENRHGRRGRRHQSRRLADPRRHAQRP